MTFPATRLSVVERTRSDDAEVRRVALDTIIDAYWKPAYKYLRLKWSLAPDAAADLTQDFFTLALEKDVVEKYDPSRARFRTYLRMCLDGFASNAKKAERRLKRGGGVTLVPLDFETAEGEMATHAPAVDADVDELFYREWVRALLERSVVDRRYRDQSPRRHAQAVQGHRARSAARADIERRGMGSGSREAARPFDAPFDSPSGRRRPVDSLRAGPMISDRTIDRLREAAAWPDLAARYEITGLAGRGGMGTVYIARDQVLDREVAVKVLDVADQKGSRAARLQREAHILARLDHPAIVPIHDAGTLPDGRTFYVMKLVRGRRLDDLVTAGEPLANRLDVFSKILDAVAFAHAQGVVHRDLKPANVMVGAFGEVYVMDWGVAQNRESESELAVVGTPGFMPPEQELARGRVDGRADVFALGAMLSHLAGATAPTALKAIADKARHPDADRRYQNVPALAADLARFRNRDPVEAHRESISERAIRLYRRYELPVLLLLAYVMMRFALLVFRGI
jgi:hypothetical protein